MVPHYGGHYEEHHYDQGHYGGGHYDGGHYGGGEHYNSMGGYGNMMADEGAGNQNFDMSGIMNSVLSSHGRK